MTNFEELVKRAKSGDAEAMQALYKATVQSVYYTIVNLINDRTQAEDLTQDVYVAVLKNLDRLSKPEAFPRWVNRIAANTARNYLKKHKPILFATDEQEEDAIGNLPAVGEDFLPEEYAVNQELREELMAAVRSLPEKQRLAIFLHYFEGMTVAELSKALEVGENTVKSRLNAGRSGIAKKLAKAGVSGATATVLGLAFRNDCMASYVPAGTRAGIWLGVESQLGIAAGNAAAAAAGAAAEGASAGVSAATGAGAAGTAAGTTSGVAATAGAAAAKAGIFSLLGVKIAAAALAVAVVAGGVIGGVHLFSNDKDEPTSAPAQTAAPSKSPDKTKVDKPESGTDPVGNPYGIPEEIIGIASWLDPLDPEDQPVLELATHDFGEVLDVFEFAPGTRLEYYQGGYAKLYISADTIAQTECSESPKLDIVLNDPEGEMVHRNGYYGSNVKSTSGDLLNYIGTVDNKGNAIYYIEPNDIRTDREPVSITFTDRENNDQLLLKLDRDSSGLSGLVENLFYPTEAGAALPELDTFYLELAAMPFETAKGWFGTPEFDWSWQVYVYPYGDVCLAFAFGEAAGVNYVMTELDRLLPDMTEPLTFDQMTEIFPDGVEGEDYESGETCFYWYYKDCPVFIYPNREGLYEAGSSVQYNCAEIVMENMPEEPTVRTSFNGLIGMTKSEMDAYFGTSGIYDTNGISCSYTYDTMTGPVYCYMEGMNKYGDDVCISVVAYAPTLVENFNKDLNVTDLREMFGDYYEDPFAGYSTYRTVMDECELVLYMDEYEFTSECMFSYTRLGGAEIRTATIAMDNWSNGWEYRELTVSPALDWPYRTETQLRLHSIIYTQLDAPYHTAEARDLILRSTDGKTYTASGVTDNWGNVYDLTVTIDAYAMYLDWDITQPNYSSEFSFESWIAYYIY